MIIDFHCHLRYEGMFSKWWYDTQVKEAASLSGRPEEKVRERLKESWGSPGDLLVEDMDKAGIDKSVLHVLDYGLALGCGENPSLEETHRIHAEAVKRHPNRLIAFAGIDPRRAGAVEFLERAVKEWGFKGLKIHPGFGFYPNDPKCYLLYGKAQELGIPVLVHTGPDSMPYYSKYSQPIVMQKTIEYTANNTASPVL